MATVAADQVFGVESALPANIYLLGLGPTINASWLLSAALMVPSPLQSYLRRLQKRGEEAGLVFSLACYFGV